MKKRGIFESIVRQFKSLTVEPVVMLSALGMSVVYGSGVTTNLMIWKICHLELNYTEEICQNLTAEENQEINKIVLKELNTFLMYSQYISSVPIILFASIAGALSDVFGRKPLIFFSLFGSFVSTLMNLINSIFIETLPLEFFYLDQLSAFFGGYAVYYLGTYSYITDVTKQKERAYRLARLDGIEILGFLSGTYTSPVIAERIGYSGSYSISAAVIGLSLVYLLFIVKEPVQRTIENKHPGQSNTIIFNAIITPFNDFKHLITKKRKPILKLLLFLQFFCFFIYWLNMEIKQLIYSYLLAVFVGFGPTEYSYYSLLMPTSSVFFLMVVLPILSTKFKLHDATIIILAVSFEVAGLVVCPFLGEYWQFFIAQSFLAFGNCKFPLVRALMSRCILPTEVGKVFSILAVLAALGPTAGNPLYRMIFNSTLDNNPGVIFFVGAGLFGLTLILNSFIYLKRANLVHGESDPDQTKEDAISTISENVEISKF